MEKIAEEASPEEAGEVTTMSKGSEPVDNVLER